MRQIIAAEDAAETRVSPGVATALELAGSEVARLPAEAE